jgi:hypothetical protein
MNICSAFDELKGMGNSNEINLVKWLRVNLCPKMNKVQIQKKRGKCKHRFVGVSGTDENRCFQDCQ